MDEHIELIDVEVSTGEAHDLLIHLLFGLWGEFAEFDSGIDLLVPLLELNSLLLGEAVSEEGLDQAGGGLHVVVFPGVLEGDREELLSAFVAGHASSKLGHLHRLLVLIGLQVDLWHFWDVNLGFVEVRQGRVGEVQAHEELLVERHDGEADPMNVMCQAKHIDSNNDAFCSFLFIIIKRAARP